MSDTEEGWNLYGVILKGFGKRKAPADTRKSVEIRRQSSTDGDDQQEVGQ